LSIEDCRLPPGHYLIGNRQSAIDNELAIFDGRLLIDGAGKYRTAFSIFNRQSSIDNKPSLG
jgi:hypothetical protein